MHGLNVSHLLSCSKCSFPYSSARFYIELLKRICLKIKVLPLWWLFLFSHALYHWLLEKGICCEGKLSVVFTKAEVLHVIISYSYGRHGDIQVYGVVLPVNSMLLKTFLDFIKTLTILTVERWEKEMGGGEG